MTWDIYFFRDDYLQHIGIMQLLLLMDAMGRMKKQISDGDLH
jgi:hypothetical protein